MRDIPENWAKKNNFSIVFGKFELLYDVTQKISNNLNSFSNVKSKFQRIAKFFRRMKSKNELIEEYLKSNVHALSALTVTL